jgi:V/A-type H+-transporting ATPase subunit E
MEELLSTDSIHKEILDDARRKADKALKGAEGAVAKAAADWAAKLAGALAEVKARYDTELTEKRAEAKVRLTMDKERARLQKTTEGLLEAERRFFAAAAPEDLLALLETTLVKRLNYMKTTFPDLDFGGAQVVFDGMSESDARTLLKKVNLSAVNLEKSGSSKLPSIILTTSEVRVTSSVDGEAGEMLRLKRAEATEALFG